MKRTIRYIWKVVESIAVVGVTLSLGALLVAITAAIILPIAGVGIVGLGIVAVTVPIWGTLLVMMGDDTR